MTLPKTTCSVCGKPIKLQRKQKATDARWACADCFDKRHDTQDPTPRARKDRSLVLALDMNNAAFDDDWRQEVARILRALASDYEAGNSPRFLMDVNGNTAGTVTLDGDVS